MTLGKQAFEDIEGKEEMLVTSIFLLFLQCFVLCHKEKSSFLQYLLCCLQNAVNLVMSKILLFGKELNNYPYAAFYLTLMHLNHTL